MLSLPQLRRFFLGSLIALLGFAVLAGSARAQTAITSWTTTTLSDSADITVSGITGTSGQTVIVVYGDASVSASGKTTSPATGGTNNFITQSKSVSGGTLTALSNSPVAVTTVPPDGQGDRKSTRLNSSHT